MENGYNFGSIILTLRKSKNITQEELAQKLNISSQAISKWENGACLPDTQMLPLLARFFNVSIDYLFNGDNSIKDKNINEAAGDYIASFGQFQGYNQAIELFAYIHSGLCGNASRHIENVSQHISYMADTHGLSMMGLKQGFGVITSKSMFEQVSPKTLEFAEPILKSLTDSDKSKIILALISMDSASLGELTEMTELDENTLRSALDLLIKDEVIWEEKSKHKQLGTVYHFEPMKYAGICTLLATLEITRQAMAGITCYGGVNDYPVKY